MSQHHRKAWTSADARRWRPRIAATLPAPCVDCGRPVYPDQDWQVGHIRALSAYEHEDYEGSKTTENLGPTHRSCNAKAGGRLGAAKTNARRAMGSSQVVTLPQKREKSPGQVREEASFRHIETTPVPATAPFLSWGPREWRDSGASPLHVSSYDGSRQFRHELLDGAELLGFGTDLKPLPPQTFVIADVLNAQGDDGLSLNSTIGISIPRRSSKTTSIWMVALGRLNNPDRPGYQVGYTAQNGTKARQRFKIDIAGPLERKYPDPKTRPFKINQTPGLEHVVWPDGSRLSILPPIADNWRGDAFDMAIVDEGQALEVEKGADLLTAILPTQDTRPGAQLIVAGTPGKHRSGPLWNTLEQGRRGDEGVGIVEYAASDYTTPEQQADPALWATVHPGVGNLTSLKTLIKNYPQYVDKPQDWAAEYLGIWPTGGGGSFIDMTRWAGLGIDAEPVLPDHYVRGIAVHPDQKSAAIVAVWRDESDAAHILVLDHRPGVRWLVPEVVKLARADKKIFTAHDTYGPMLVEVEALQRHAARPLLAPQSMADVKTAAATLLKDLDDSKLHHYRQDVLDAAAEKTIKRKIGNGWGIGPANRDEDDIVALEAASYALHAYDEAVPAAPLVSMFA